MKFTPPTTPETESVGLALLDAGHGAHDVTMAAYVARMLLARGWRLFDNASVGLPSPREMEAAQERMQSLTPDKPEKE